MNEVISLGGRRCFVCHRLFIALFVLGLLATPAFATSECRLIKYGELPVTMQKMRPLVKGTVNRKPALFVVDSGAFISMLTNTAAKKFGIETYPLPSGMFIGGDTGYIAAMGGSARQLTVAGLAGGRVFRRFHFLVGWYTSDAGSDGAIGQDILGRADTEYDIADGVIRLFLAKGCRQKNLAYWAGTKPVVSMPTRVPSGAEDQLYGTALLNGKKIRVLFDTGTPYSTLTMKAAKRVGLSLEDKDVVDAGLTGGIAQGHVEDWIAHFKSLDLDGEIIKNARLNISNIGDFDADLLLGADFFLSHRIFYSSAQHRLYFTYNGGPVFDFRRSDVKAEMAQLASHGNRSLPGVPANKRDAASLKRRAMASINRREYGMALADFDALIRRSPQDADNYLQRGFAHFGNRQPKLALNDLDKALQIKPSLVKAHILRGTIYLRQGEDEKASEDFNAAMNAAPRHSSVELEIGDRYLRTGKFGQAIVYFNAWIADNPKSLQLPGALTARCEARALLNEGLKLALEDCKSAFHGERVDSYMLGNLALVYLRLGNYGNAVKYYEKSIELQPKDAWVLYGLGLAEQKNGMKSESAKSVKQALALDPKVADHYKRVGLSL